MKETIHTEQRPSEVNTFLVVCFCILILFPLLLTPFSNSNDGQKLSIENRLAATWPNLSILKQSFVEYTGQINGYLEDHLIFRRQILSFYAKLHLKLLGSGSGGKAIIGTDGWLFLSSGNNLRNARGADPLSSQEARNWAQSALAIQNEVESYGGKFMIVIIPDKAQVYSENLPKQIVYKRDGRRADTLVQALDEVNLNYLDLLDPLLAAKQDHASPLYFKTDTHWSFVGALDSYQIITKQLNDYDLNLPIVERLQLRISNKSNYSGDLARLLNLEDIFNETMRGLIPHRSVELFDREKDLLMLGDSFSAMILPYFEYSFINTKCVHHNWGDINLNIIKQEQADVVILQMVERGLEYSLSTGSQPASTCGESF